MIDPKTAQLIAINEALNVLDYGMASRDVLPADELVVEAYELLAIARSRLTNKPWPSDLPHPQLDSSSTAAWLHQKHGEQKKDGRA